MEPRTSSPVALILTDRDGPARRPHLDALSARSPRPVVDLGTPGPDELARALTAAPTEGLCVAASSRPSAVLAAARAAAIPTMLMLRALDSDELDELAAEIAASDTDGVPVAGWLPHRSDPRSLAVDAALGTDRLGGIAASRIVRLDGRSGAPTHDVIDLLDLAMRWHDRPVTSITALTTRDPSRVGGAAVRFEDGGSTLLEWGSISALPDAGYDETLLIGRTRTLDLPWEVLHETRVGKGGACPAPLADPEELFTASLLDWASRPTAASAATPARALVTALRLAHAFERSAATGATIAFPGTTSGDAR